MRFCAFGFLCLLFLTGCSEEKLEERAEVDRSEKFVISPKEGIDLDSFLRDKLVQIEANEFVPITDFTAPEKYYAFYETASWCGACKKFNSTLLSFYEVYHELYGDTFEIVLISYDQSEELMRDYAVENQIKFPHLGGAEREMLANNLPILTAKLPNLIITNSRGEVLKSAFNRTGKYHGPEVAMNYLKSQLEEQ